MKKLDLILKSLRCKNQIREVEKETINIQTYVKFKRS